MHGYTPGCAGAGRHCGGVSNVLTSRAERTVYSYDASVFRGRDVLAVVFPDTVEHIRRIVTWCNQHGIRTLLAALARPLAVAPFPPTAAL